MYKNIRCGLDILQASFVQVLRHQISGYQSVVQTLIQKKGFLILTGHADTNMILERYISAIFNSDGC